MTPAINLVKQRKIFHKVHEYVHDANAASYGSVAAEKLGVPESQVFKTLVVKLDGKTLAVGVVPVAQMLSLKAIAKAAKAKKAVMAEQAEVERSTGYVLGGVSPLGQKKRLVTVVDESALEFERIFISAGKRGLEIELAAQDLIDLLSGNVAAIAA